MRAEVKSGSELGNKLKVIMDSGGLVPLDMTVQVLKNGVKAHPAQNYLFDGFPRQMDQVEYLVQNKIFNPAKILYYKVP
jgi:adenylate kinase family enzyme